MALYVVVVGFTGSILVFREELATLAKIHEGEPFHSTLTMADAVPVAVQAAPGRRITFAVPPTTDHPYYIFGIHGQSPIYVDAASAKRVLPRAERTWIEFVAALHYELALGEFGWHANGAGSVALLLLAVTGLFLWWPGIASFFRSLLVDFRKGWKRVIWDLHTVTGVYASGMLVMWSLTAVLFIWPETLRFPLGLASQISIPSIPVVPVRDVPVQTMLKRADAFVSRLPGRLRRVSLPIEQGQPVTIVVAREPGRHALHHDQFYLDPSTGEQVGAWRAEDGKTLSDWVLRVSYPLHTGMFWGLLVRILWAVLGLMIPLLGVTGVVMYWNRFLSRKWDELRRPSSPPTLAVRGVVARKGPEAKIHRS